MIYIASPFFNEKQVNLVSQIEKVLNNNRIEYYSPRSEGVLMCMTEEEKQKSKKDIYEKNIYHIKECSMMVAVIDDRDTGTIWEMGYAAALNIPIISMSNNNYGLNVMLAESVQAHTIGIVDMIHAVLDPTYTGQIQRGVF